MTLPAKPLCPYNPERVCRGQCFECYGDDEEELEQAEVAGRMTDAMLDAEQGDIKRAAERDEELYLSVLREQEREQKCVEFTANGSAKLSEKGRKRLRNTIREGSEQ